ncbi:MAG: TonB-dependent receptor, partial [Methylobacter sp.]
MADDIEVSGNAYFRQNRIRTFNGDNSNYGACDADPALLCDQQDVIVQDVNGNQVAATDAVEGATNNTSQTYMRSRGGTLQTAFAQDLFK